jgi:hypothetical protein
LPYRLVFLFTIPACCGAIKVAAGGNHFVIVITAEYVQVHFAAGDAKH